MLGAAQADALSSEGHGPGSLVGLVGVGADLKPPEAVGPAHEFGKPFVVLGFFRIQALVDQHLDHLGGFGLQTLLEHFSGGSVEGDPVPFGDGASGHLHGVIFVVNLQSAAASHTDLAHLASHKGGVGGRTAPSGQNALSRIHSTNVFGRGLNPHQDDFFATFGPSFGVFSVEDHLAGGGPRAGVEALGQQTVASEGSPFVILVEYRLQDLVEGVGFDPSNGLGFVDQSLFHQVDGDLDGRKAGPFS